jgi:hypothetical protein
MSRKVALKKNKLLGQPVDFREFVYSNEIICKDGITVSVQKQTSAPARALRSFLGCFN